MIGLCDANSFFASSEKVFRPDLKEKGVVVLSNNDGIIVALDSIAKKCGLKRGDAWFEVGENATKKGIVAFSSNYTLYGDLSNRVMKCLSNNTIEIEQYSIDEAFFTPKKNQDIERLQKIVTRETGIPVSIGLGRTKTLSKVATKLAKKEKSNSFVLYEEAEDEELKKIDISSVWGVGRAWEKKLKNEGIKSAYDLKTMDNERAQKDYSITLLRTILELRGLDAHKEGEINQNLYSGISFKTPITKKGEMIKALATEAETLSKKLKEKHLLCSSFGLNFFTSRFIENTFSPYETMYLDYPTSYTPKFIEIIKVLTDRLFLSGYEYKGCRVFAFSLIKEKDREQDFFKDEKKIKKEEKLSEMVFELKRDYGNKKIQLGTALGLEKQNLMKREKKSPYYTTRFTDLPLVY